MSFVCSYSYLDSTSDTAVLYPISRYIWPRCNGTRLYHSKPHTFRTGCTPKHHNHHTSHCYIITNKIIASVLYWLTGVIQGSEANNLLITFFIICHWHSTDTDICQMGTCGCRIYFEVLVILLQSNETNDDSKLAIILETYAGGLQG